MSSLCRTTSLLVSKESDGLIAYNSREKEDSLSLKMGEQIFCISFSFLPLYVFLSFLLFFFFSHFSSHLSFTFSSFSLLLWSFSLPFWSNHSFGQKEEISSHFSSNHLCSHQISLFIPYFLFMTSSTTWLNVSHGIPFPHMAHCEPFFQVDHMALPSVTLLGCHGASLNLAMCHPTPHASKNVKSLPPRNSTKFDVVAKFRETISTEKSVSSSDI